MPMLPVLPVVPQPPQLSQDRASPHALPVPPPALQHPLLISLRFPWLTYYLPRHLCCVHCDYTEDTSKGPSSAILAL